MRSDISVQKYPPDFPVWMYQLREKPKFDKKNLYVSQCNRLSPPFLLFPRYSIEYFKVNFGLNISLVNTFASFESFVIRIGTS